MAEFPAQLLPHEHHLEPVTTPTTREEILTIARTLSAKFAERASKHDLDRSFPYENYADLRAAGYPALTVPQELGGWGASLTDAVMAQEILGAGDGSTALSVTMHVQTMGSAASGEKWDQAVYTRLAEQVITRGTLVNSCATEPELGSPSRGGKPMTTARHEGSDWVITGRKSFASMSPTLDYFIIPAVMEGEHNAEGKELIGRFLVPRQDNIIIEETWEAMGMRSTGSHDLLLNGARVAETDLISTSAVGLPDPNKITQNSWFTLTVSAVYLGIAGAAQQAAMEYAHQRTPTALGRSIATLESVQRRLGQAELELQVARSVLYRAAEQWDAHPDARHTMHDMMVITKLHVTNAAVSIVDQAMRAVGGNAMTKSLPLERYYRDVRAGLYHPPVDDQAIPQLGRVALGRIKPLG